MAFNDQLSVKANNLLKETWQHSSPEQAFIRLEFSIDPLDILDWLYRRAHPVKIYWRARDQAFEMAGIGQADRVQATDLFEARTFLNTLKWQLNPESPHMRYFGGLRFPMAPVESTPWESFQAATFVLPQIEVVRENNDYTLVFNLRRQEQHSLGQVQRQLDEVLALLNAPEPVSLSVPSDLGPPEYLPTYPEWFRQIREVQELFSNQKLEKIVLARQTRYTLAKKMNPLTILKSLGRSDASAFIYFFQFEPGKALLGATPERLYYRQHRQLQTEAVAGTRPLAHHPELDLALKNELLNSGKDRLEHRLVSEHLERVLGRLCLQMRSHPLEVIRTSHVQHLYQYFEGQLLPEITDADILTALHPTPAVGGAPQADALSQLNQMSCFDRGWYSAPVGWIGHQAAEFAVALRCALFHPRSVYLYAGAGIVPESIASQEWQEIEAKTKTLFSHFSAHLENDITQGVI